MHNYLMPASTVEYSAKNIDENCVNFTPFHAGPEYPFPVCVPYLIMLLFNRACARPKFSVGKMRRRPKPLKVEAVE